MTPELKIFQPDLFSDPVPRFHKLDANSKEAGEISAFFIRHFKLHSGFPRAIWKSGGIEVNSRNFRIDTDHGPFLLKRLSPSPGEKPVIEMQQSLLSWLKDKGAPVPTPIRSATGTYLCAAGKANCWAAMTFVEGRFFEGGTESVAHAGRAIGRLHRILMSVPAELSIDRSYVHLSADDETLFEEVLSENRGALALFDQPEARLLVQSRDLLLRAWGTACARRDIYRTGEIGLIHIDLHPHNLLMQDGHLAAFIDFNSLKTGPLNMMLGFSTYKLLRQAVQSTDPGMDPADCRRLTNDFLDNFYKEFPGQARFREDVGYFALAEVCRRIGIIFRLTLRQRNTTWNHVLKVHLAGLREISTLFGLEYGKC